MQERYCVSVSSFILIASSPTIIYLFIFFSNSFHVFFLYSDVLLCPLPLLGAFMCAENNLLLLFFYYYCILYFSPAVQSFFCSCLHYLPLAATASMKSILNCYLRLHEVLSVCLALADLLHFLRHMNPLKVLLPHPEGNVSHIWRLIA